MEEPPTSSESGFGAWLTAWHIISVDLAWALVAERLFRYAEKTNIISIPDFLEHGYKSKAAKTCWMFAILKMWN
ncbi:MAG: hypothetical protein DRJ37_06700 [Thermoprotei archaeon]|nr:MAG: hypothetical protein DRJ37_06700 [Thermoprotei archaeon]